MASPLRASTSRTILSFSATASKRPSVLNTSSIVNASSVGRVSVGASARTLHITGANSTPSQSYLAFQAAMAQASETNRSQSNRARKTKSPSQPTRTLNTSRHLSHRNDNSTIDFAYMPDLSTPLNHPTDIQIQGGRMPLLPDNFTSSHSASTFEPTETVRKPEISLMTAEVGEVVSALSEVDGGKAADALGLMKEGEDGGGKEGEKGTFRVVWEGVLDDLFGERRK